MAVPNNKGGVVQHIQPQNSRMVLANVVRGIQPKPLRVLIYGVEGCGKTTFAANAPSPIFLCAEDGTAQLDVARFPSPNTWFEAFEAINTLIKDDHDFQTLAIDTLDWLEPLCWEHVCNADGKANIESYSYGKGYTAALDQWRLLIRRLDTLVRVRKMHVILVGHAAVRKVDDPQTGPFDRYRMKLHERAGDLWREWVDAVLFARHEAHTVQPKGNGKARGVSSGARVMHTQWNAAFDAKNRFDLPETMPLSWEDFEHAVKDHLPATLDKLNRQLETWIPQLADEAEQEKARVTRRDWAGQDPRRLAQLLNKVRAKVNLAQAEKADEDSQGSDAEEPNP